MAKKYINLPTEEINKRLAKIPELETGKQDVIENLEDIISGAEAGATALQPKDIAEWAKQPDKPTYTASEVGALPSDTSIPTIPDNIVIDENYVHTDNNFDDAAKEKLAGLENYNDTELKENVNNKVDKQEGQGLSKVADATVTADGKLNIEKQDGTVIEFNGGGGEGTTLPLSVVDGQLCITFNS